MSIEMNILICDDEHLARERLTRLVDGMDGYTVVATAANGVEAINIISNDEIDIVLLDIRMPGMDGIEVAQHLTKAPQPPAVIFCTAYDEHALEAFKVQAMNYLLKPVRKEELHQALNNAKRINKAQLTEFNDSRPDSDDNLGRQHISAKSHKGIELIPIDDIYYFMADQKYVTIKYGEGEILIDETLKELESEFPNRFVRIHRNALVATAAIEGMELLSPGHYQIRMKNVDERLTVSRRHIAKLRKVMQAL